MIIQLLAKYNKKMSNGFFFMNWDGKCYIRQGDNDLWLSKNIVETLLYKKSATYTLGIDQNIVLERDDLITILETYSEYDADGHIIMPDTQFGE